MNRKLKAKIVERFGSQADFAAVVGVDESVISRIVNGRRVLSPEDMVRWSKALACNSEIFQAGAAK